MKHSIILLLLTLSFNLFPKSKSRMRKHQIYLGLNTTKVFDIAGNNDGTRYMAQQYMESEGKVLGYQFWIVKNVSVFAQYDFKREVDLSGVVSTGSSSVYSPEKLSVTHFAIGANYHTRITRWADLFIGLNNTVTEINGYEVDPSIGLQFGIGAKFKRIRTSFTWKRNLIKAASDDGLDSWKGDINYLYITLGFLI